MASNALGLELDSAARLSKRPGSVWNCLLGHALKRSPGIISKSRVSYPGPGFLSNATWPSLPKKHFNGLIYQSINHQLIIDTLAASGQTVFDTRLGCLADNMNPLYQDLIDASMASLSTSTRLKFSLLMHRNINTPTVKKFNQAEKTFFG